VTGISAGKAWSRIGAEVAPTSSAASGVWQIGEVAENVGAGTWPAWDALKLSGGTETESGGYKYYTFNSTGTLTVTNDGVVDILMIAGGGGGGGQFSYNGSAGGGAGGYRTFDNITIYDGTYTLTVGAGGAAGGNEARGSKGSNTTFNQATGSGWTDLSCTGGGGGGVAMNPSAQTGGSASGTAYYQGNWHSTGASGNEGGYTPAEGNDSQSSSAWNTAGGGGAGSDGGNGMSSQTWGGDGSTWHDGVTRGGGGAYNSTDHGYLGGGGGSSRDDGVANTGGGAAARRGPGAADGGSGVVIVRVAA